MASTRSRWISGPRRRRSSSVPDLRRVIAYRKEEELKHKFIAIIGDIGSGRNTLVRRFLNMSDGPFQQPEDRRYAARPVLVDLSERPNIPRNQIVRLGVFIINLQQLNFQTLHQTLSTLKSTAVMFDVACSNTLYTAIHCMVKITEFLGSRAPRFILIGNKIDLPRREVSSERGEEVAEICGAQNYYECSALMNTRVDQVLDAILFMAFYSRYMRVM